MVRKKQFHEKQFITFSYTKGSKNVAAFDLFTFFHADLIQSEASWKLSSTSDRSHVISASAWNRLCVYAPYFTILIGSDETSINQTLGLPPKGELQGINAGLPWEMAQEAVAVASLTLNIQLEYREIMFWNTSRKRLLIFLHTSFCK